MSEPRYFITLLRHGESVGNAEGRWQGRSEFPLSQTGQAQAQALAERWNKEAERFDLIITSPLARAKETALILSEALHVPMEEDPLWMERDIAEFSGLKAEEAHNHTLHPDFINPYNTVGGGGEGDWELFLRAGKALHHLLRRPAGRYLVISHGGLLNQVMHAIVGVGPHANNSGPRFRFGNTGFARLVYYPDQHCWAIDALNDMTHWRQGQRLSEN